MCLHNYIYKKVGTCAYVEWLIHKYCNHIHENSDNNMDPDIYQCANLHF